MKRKITLYINGRKADLQDQGLVLMNYAVSELQRPTAVKNSYSKQITLPGTPANDRIFSHAYRGDMAVTATSFNPLERTPFKIFNDTGEVLQSGYLKLDRIDRAGNTRNYVVTLYGGLGSFFYSLMYDENGEKRTLASLAFGVNDNNFHYTLNKSTLNNAWGALATNPGTSTLWGITNFAPCYNGLPEGLEADKVRLSTDYSKMAELSRKYTEWEVRDLRCWLQRPALRVRAVLEAIFQEGLSAGKSIKLDTAFFSASNPYFNKTWMLLPMLSAYENESAGQIGERSQVEAGYNTQLYAEIPTGDAIGVSGPTFSSSGPYKYIDFSAFDASYYLKGEVYGELKFSEGGGWYRMGYLNWWSNTAYRWYGTLIGVQYFVRYGNSYTKSKLQIFGQWAPDNAADSARLDNLLSIFGESEYLAMGNLIGSVTQPYGIFENIPVAAASDARILVTIAAVSDYTTMGEDTFRCFDSENDGSNYSTGQIEFYDVSGGFTLNSPGSVGSGTTITKNMLLADTESPADFLLSFCKQFNLRIAETGPDEISILSLQSFYNGSTEDLEKRVDRKQIKVVPLLFEKKWQKLGLKIPETSKAKQYKNDYGKDFGTISLDTGYQLNADTEDFFKDSIFKGGVSGLLASGLMYDFFASGGAWISPCLLGGITIDGTTTYPQYSTRTALNSAHPGYDFARKMFGFSIDGKEQKPVDIAGTLVFFSGVISNPGYWFATEKYGGAADEECWQLNVNGLNDTYTEKITKLPVFSRYFEETAGRVSRSLDFGTPAEIYDPGLLITPDSSIYTRAWQSFLVDQCDKSNKRLTAKVHFDGLKVGVDLLRRFYHYDGSLWVLNKITNYSLTTYDPAECEFIQVQEKDNYTNGQTW